MITDVKRVWGGLQHRGSCNSQKEQYLEIY